MKRIILLAAVFLGACSTLDGGSLSAADERWLSRNPGLGEDDGFVFLRPSRMLGSRHAVGEIREE